MSFNHLLAGIIAASLCLIPFAVFAQSGQDYFEQGNSLYNQKKYAEATSAYRHAIQAQPISLPKAYLNCARAYSMLKDYSTSFQYYQFYEDVSDTGSDKKVKAEAKAVEKKAKGESYYRDAAQTTVLNQIETAISEKTPFLTKQGNGILAYYDVLTRAGFAEPELYTLQRQIVKGMTTELMLDVTPPPGQPLPNLDRTGWEFIHTKINKLRQFVDVQPDNKLLEAVEVLATAWETYYRGDYSAAMDAFDTACAYEPALPAAYWGRLMIAFQLEQNDSLLDRIDKTEEIYNKADISQTSHFFALLRAQAYRNLNDIPHSLEWLNIMQSKL